MTRHRPYLEINLDTLEWEWWPWIDWSSFYPEISGGWGWLVVTLGWRTLNG